jgi:hypothetical protein
MSLEGEKSTSIAFSRQWQVGPDTGIIYNVTVYTTLDGDENHSNDTLKFVTKSIGYTAVEEQATLNVQIGPDLQVSPNPFRRNTLISYQLPVMGNNAEHTTNDSRHITLSIHDITGRIVRRLVNEEKEPGRHNTTFDAKGLPGGIYFARLAVGEDRRETKKLILLR